MSASPRRDETPASWEAMPPSHVERWENPRGSGPQFTWNLRPDINEREFEGPEGFLVRDWPFPESRQKQNPEEAPSSSSACLASRKSERDLPSRRSEAISRLRLGSCPHPAPRLGSFLTA